MTDKEKIKLWAKGQLFELMNGVGEKDAESVLTDFLTFIDSLQEEPVAPKVLEDMLNAKTAAESLGISQEEHDRIVDELIYGKEPEMVDIDDLHKEEPVSEDLEKASKEWLTPQLDKSYAVYGEAKMMELTHFDGYAMLDAIEFGVKWQKEQMMKDAVVSLVTDVIIHNDGDEVKYSVAYPIGKRLFNEGDKVKVIVIKED